MKRLLRAAAAFFVVFTIVFQTVGAGAAELYKRCSNPFAYQDLKRDIRLRASEAKTIDSMSPEQAASLQRQARLKKQPKQGQGLVVRFNPEASYYEINKLLQNYKYRLLSDSSQRVFRVAADLTAFKAAAGGLIQSAEPDGRHYKTASTPVNDTYSSEQYAINSLSLSTAWDITTGSDSVKVAVIDSGVDITHPDLFETTILDGEDIIYGGSVEFDTTGHGTGVTGIIAAASNNSLGIAGTCWDVTIKPFLVFDIYGYAMDSDIIDALYHAADSGCKVINMSFGGTVNSSAMNTAIQYAASKGCILVAAAGNDGNATLNYPAAYNNVISVAAIDSADKKAVFSNSNNKVDVCAPGKAVRTLIDPYCSEDGSKYTVADGTSFSAPYVTGIAALAAACKPAITPAEFETLLRTTSTDLGPAGYDNSFGYGKINAYNVVSSLTGSMPKLSNLTVSAGALSPSFKKTHNNYNVTLMPNQPSVTIAATKEYSSYQLYFDDIAASSKTVSLSMGNSKVVKITVKTSDGSQAMNYYVKVTRYSLLTNIKITPERNAFFECMYPVFDPNVSTYEYFMSAGSSYVDITPIKAAAGVGTVTIDDIVCTGQKRVYIPQGATKTVKVTAQSADGTVNKIYSIKLIKENLIDYIYFEDAAILNDFSSDVTTYSGKIDPQNGPADIFILPGTLEDITIEANGIPVDPYTYSVQVPLSDGDRTTITITASITGSQVSTTYTYDLIHQSSDAHLADISITSGAFSPAFNENNTNCWLYLNESSDTTTITPVVKNNATFTIDGQTVESVTATVASGQMKQYTILVTSEDGLNFQTYIVYVFGLYASYTSLSQLNISAGEISPEFRPDILSYTVNLAEDQESVTITAQAANPQADITFLGVKNAPVTVAVGKGQSITRSLKVSVNSSNSTYYNITFVREASSNAKLSDLKLISSNKTIPLDKSFEEDVYEYSVVLKDSERSFSVNAVTQDENAIVSINGVHGITRNFELAGGQSIDISVNVVSQSGEVSNTYIIHVSMPISNDATINYFYLYYPDNTSDFVLTEQDKYTCSITVPTQYSSLIVNAVCNPDATVVYSGCQPNEFGWFLMELDPGQTKVIYITVTSQSGLYTNYYTVSITRRDCDNAYLQELNFSAGYIAPDFDKNTLNYTVYIPETTAANSLWPVKDSQYSSMKIDGKNVSSISFSLKAGDTKTVKIELTSHDKTVTKVYTLNLICISFLKEIGLSAGKLTPAFSPTIRDYSVYLPPTATGVTVTPKSDFCSFTINGKSVAYYNVNLVSANYACVKIVAEIGKISCEFTVNIIKTKPVSKISITGAVLSPVYNTAVTGYTASMPVSNTSATVSVTKGSNCSGITINGSAVNSMTFTLSAPGASCSVVIQATLTDGTKITYNITIKRQEFLSGIKLSAGRLTPAFKSSVYTYKVYLAPTASSIVITPTLVNGKMTINGAAVTSVTLKPALNGSASARILCYSGQATAVYMVYVYRTKPISALKVTGGTLSPAFSPTTTSYTINVPATTTVVAVAVTKGTNCPTLRMNGYNVTSLSLRPAVGGTATAKIVATAPDGYTTTTYTVTVKRAPLITGIKLSTGSISPAFNPVTTAYTVNMSATATSITITPVKATYGVKSIAINNKIASSITLKPARGSTTKVTVTVAASDGVTKVTYTITVKRA